MQQNCRWYLASVVLLAVSWAVSWVNNSQLRAQVHKLEAEAAALQACIPQAEGDLSAMARTQGKLECAMTTRGDGRRKVVSRFTYET